MRPSLSPRPLLRLTCCAAVLAAAAGGCSKGGGDGQVAGPVVPQVSPAPLNGSTAAPEPSGNSPLAALDASGRLANKAVWPAQAVGQANGRRSFFTFAAPAAGAFYMSKVVVTPVDCDIRQVGARLFAGRLAAEGTLESWQRIDPFEVIRLGEGQRLLVSVEGDGQAACGDIEVLLAARFLATQPADGGHAPVGVGPGPDPQNPGPGPGPAPGPTPLPGPGPGPSPQPGPGPSPGPTPDPGPSPTPAPTPTPNPGQPACDGQGPNASDPAILRAALRIYGQRGGGGTCETTLTWKLSDLVRRDPQNNCKFPEVRLVEGSGSPLLKLQVASPTLATNLAWLQLQTTGERDAVKAALTAGNAVDLVAPVPFGRPDSERCAVPGAPASPKLTNDLDLTLFQGDPRESCLNAKGALQNLELTDAAHDFRVDRTGSSLQFTFTWPRSLAAASGVLRLRAYDRRLKLFVSGWTDVAAAADGAFTGTLTGDDAKGALATQGDLELIVSEGTVPAAGTSCQRALLFPYARYFLDSSFGGAFHGGSD